MSSLAPYPSPEARETELESLARRAGGELVVYGESVEGRPLRAARLPATSPGERPAILCAANIHGVEFIGGRVALALARAAGDDDRPAALDRLRARADLWIIPCVNPDGYARTWAAEGRARQLGELRANARGVDLNRNFPRPGDAPPSRWPGSGSDRPGDPTYRGPHPLSEPETACLDAFLRARPIHASANLHSFMGTVIPARVTDWTRFRAYKHLYRAFTSAQRARRYRRLSTMILDVFTGEQEDHQHHALDTWAVCVECFPVVATLRQHLRAPSWFWRFNPREPQRWIDNDLPGLLAYYEAALELPRPSELTRPALAAARRRLAGAR
ncbi:MAG: hypothetical protein H6713_31070 [Myxococcales bacterium]|nr:hypothetical protein [Myxococcales bacterium]